MLSSLALGTPMPRCGRWNRPATIVSIRRPIIPCSEADW